MTTGARTALVIAAHGASDSAAHELVRAHARRIAGLGSEFEHVTAAFHLGAPGWADAIESLEAGEVTVVPFFLGSGHFSSRVLPRVLRGVARSDSRRLLLAPPVGEHPRAGALASAQIRSRMEAVRWQPDATTVVVVGHGTRRHPRSRVSTELLAAELASGRIAASVLTAYLDDDPPLAEVLSRAPRRQVLVYPFLIGGGSHVTRDLRAALRMPESAGAGPERRGTHDIVIDSPFGLRPELAELVIESARQALPVRPRAGTVHLVGAGPGAADLITLRGRRLLRAADVVLHDRLVAPELLALARPGARVMDVGKWRGGGTPQDEVNRLIVEHAGLGRRVVRLKGGDPGVFGRADEELAACRARGIRVRIVPGVSSIVAAPAAAGFPLTLRGSARSFAVVTAEAEGQDTRLELAKVATADTLVLLMARAALREAAAELIRLGRDPQTPAAAVEKASQRGERIVYATLATLADQADAADIGTPAVAVIGAVATQASVRQVAATAQDVAS